MSYDLEEPGEDVVIVLGGCASQRNGTDDDGFHWYAAGCPDPATWQDIVGSASAAGNEPKVVWAP